MTEQTSETALDPSAERNKSVLLLCKKGRNARQGGDPLTRDGTALHVISFAVGLDNTL